MDICCDGKHGFRERDFAEKVASRMHRGKVMTYKCPICRLWHIGGTRKKRRIQRDEVEA